MNGTGFCFSLIVGVSLVLSHTVGAAGDDAGGVKEVAPREASQVLSANSKAVLVDVRSEAEYAFVGHPPEAVNIPFMFWSTAGYDFEPNPHFTQDLTSRFSDKEVPLLFMCRSGGRSMKAAEEAVSLGYRQVYNVTEGFEGEADDQGHRKVNGWKNSGLPYTYEVSEDLRYRASD